jgi:hypothetical protein
MGILSEDRFNEMVSRLEGNEPAEEAVEAPEVSADSSEPSEDVKEVESDSSSDTEDVKEEVETRADSAEVEAPKTPEHIPYSRFKEVNDKFRSRDEDLQRAMQRIQDLEKLTLAQQPQTQQPQVEEKSEDAWLNEIFGDADDQSVKAMKQMRDEMRSMQQWQQERTEQIVTTQLEAEIAAAVEKNPDVKAAELWQAVAADGSMDVGKAAEYIQNHRNEMRQQYRSEANSEIEELKAKLAQAEKAAEEQKTFRRPSATAAAPTPEQGRPRTVADATAAFAEALKERASF